MTTDQENTIRQFVVLTNKNQLSLSVKDIPSGSYLFQLLADGLIIGRDKLIVSKN